VLRLKGLAFNGACDKEREFLERVKENTEGLIEEEIAKTSAELAAEVQRTKKDFWDAWTAAQLNGFTMFSHVSDYTHPHK
jgi:hypothetical protein